jgi:hypothetical protein
MAFDATRAEDFGELAHWFGNSAAVLTELRSRTGSSEVRCWPHHFDIATLVYHGAGRYLRRRNVAGR